jgi:glycosyltransferase involved in cell wall biosynthesis
LQHAVHMGQHPAGSLPQVSVVIATHNMGQFVAQAVDSVLTQADADLEVVVVDDGSTDSTPEALGAYRQESRVRVITQDKQGQPQAKNAGIRASRGRYIAFCDADDYWLPNKLARQLPLFARNPRVGVVYSSILALREDGSLHARPERQFFRGQVLDQMFLHNLVPFGTAVIRRECLEQAGAFDESIPMGIDWDLWLRIAIDWEFDFVPESTYVYRIWAGQMSRDWRGRYDCALRIMGGFLERYPDRLPAGIVASAYADTYTNLAAEHLHHAGMAQCLSTLRRALAHRADFWPAWRLLLSMPWYRVRNLLR